MASKSDSESKSRWLRNQRHEIISNSMASKSWPFHGFDFENLGRGRKSTFGFRIRFLNQFEIWKSIWFQKSDLNSMLNSKIPFFWNPGPLKRAPGKGAQNRPWKGGPEKGAWGGQNQPHLGHVPRSASTTSVGGLFWALGLFWAPRGPK